MSLELSPVFDVTSTSTFTVLRSPQGLVIQTVAE